jgi:hypothetical protein
MSQPQPHITELRSSLMDTLRHLGTLGRDGKPLDAEQIKAQVSLASAMKGVADTLVDTAKVEIEYIKATGADLSNFLKPEPNAPRLPQPSSTPTAHHPFPVSKSHRLMG